MEVRGRHVELRAERREERGGMGRTPLEVDTRTIGRQADRLGGVVRIRHAGDPVRAKVAGLVGAQLLPRTLY